MSTNNTYLIKYKVFYFNRAVIFLLKAMGFQENIYFHIFKKSFLRVIKYIGANKYVIKTCRIIIFSYLLETSFLAVYTKY